MGFGIVSILGMIGSRDGVGGDKFNCAVLKIYEIWEWEVVPCDEMTEGARRTWGANIVKSELVSIESGKGV